MIGLWPWLLLLGLIYFMMIRPQQKREKERREMLSSLRVGDEVVTIGGIHGRITALREDVITIEVADEMEMKFSKMAVASKNPSSASGGEMEYSEPVEEEEERLQ